jgi:circadian clock protein KaiC
MARSARTAPNRPSLRKCPTGIRGLDEITEGGLPRGRTSLVCGGPGCGKTLLAVQFIVQGITTYGEPGVFMSFEETSEELAQNVKSLGFDLKGLISRKQLAVDYVRIERSEIEETGEYDLEGLFVRLGSLIEEVGAKRVALDTLEALFAGLPDEGILRAELRRLFHWLKRRGVTSVVTAEQGEQTLTRHGLEEYVSDCVILLDHRVTNQIATRRLRVVKYRGSQHGTNEYPAAIDENGLSVLPISSLGLGYPVSTRRISTGLGRLDAMMGGKGYYRGSSILISGTSGTGKSSLAVCFADSVCARGEKCLYLSFEESAEQLKRNMASIGFDLGRWESSGLLRFHCVRPTIYGLETHLGNIHHLLEDFSPAAVVMDPVTSLMSGGPTEEVKAMLTRLIDFIKNANITALFTCLVEGGGEPENSGVGISSLMDTWILLTMIQSAGERNRLLYLLKSRGMAHSNQIREFVLSSRGIEVTDIYVGPGTVLTGSARVQQEARDRIAAIEQERGFRLRQRELTQQRMELKAQLETLKLRLETVNRELEIGTLGESERLEQLSRERQMLVKARQANPSLKGKP